MGFRNWLRSTFGSKEVLPEPSLNETPHSDEVQQNFSDVQKLRSEEALALFGEPDEIQESPTEVVKAPYDASEADANDLLNEEQNPSFTHADEVIIEDVSDIEDPYENAKIEGDISETVVLGE